MTPARRRRRTTLAFAAAAVLQSFAGGSRRENFRKNQSGKREEGIYRRKLKETQSDSFVRRKESESEGRRCEDRG